MAQQARNPTSDIAVSGTWSGTAGSRYTLVDDFPDQTVDYLQHGTTAGYIVFGFAPFNVPDGAVIQNVTVEYYDSEPSSGNNNSAGRLRVGETDYNSATHNPSTTKTLRQKVWTTNPKTGAAWTVADVNGTGSNPLQGFGLYSSDANPVWYCWSIRIVVNYYVVHQAQASLAPASASGASGQKARAAQCTAHASATVISVAGRAAGGHCVVVAAGQAGGTAKVSLHAHAALFAGLAGSGTAARALIAGSTVTAGGTMAPMVLAMRVSGVSLAAYSALAGLADRHASALIGLEPAVTLGIEATRAKQGLGAVVSSLLVIASGEVEGGAEAEAQLHAQVMIGGAGTRVARGNAAISSSLDFVVFTALPAFYVGGCCSARRAT